MTVVVRRRRCFDLGSYCMGRIWRVIMPVPMDRPSPVAVCVDMTCDDSRFTAYGCIKRIIFQCRFVVVFIVIAVVMSIMVVPLLTSMGMRKVMAMTVPVPAVLPQIAP